MIHLEPDLLRVHDFAFGDVEVSHGNQWVIGGTEGAGELVSAKGVASKVCLVLLHLTLNLGRGKTQDCGGEGDNRGGERKEKREGRERGGREEREKGEEERKEKRGERKRREGREREERGEKEKRGGERNEKRGGEKRKGGGGGERLLQLLLA